MANRSYSERSPWIGGTNRPQNSPEPKTMLTPTPGSLKTESEETWLTSAQAAEFLGISVQALMNRASNGKIPYYKFGRSNRYKKSELEALLSQNKRGPHGY